MHSSNASYSNKGEEIPLVPRKDFDSLSPEIHTSYRWRSSSKTNIECLVQTSKVNQPCVLFEDARFWLHSFTRSKLHINHNLFRTREVWFHTPRRKIDQENSVWRRDPLLRRQLEPGFTSRSLRTLPVPTHRNPPVERGLLLLPVMHECH